MNVLLSEIKLPENLVRKSVSEKGVEGLAVSMGNVGLINQIVVRKVEGGYELVAGFRRYMAAKMLKWEKISARVVKVKDVEAERIKVDENLEREDLNAIEEGLYFESVIKKREINQKELAEDLGLSESYISQRISTISWPELLKDLVEKGQMNFSVAREFSKVKNMDDMVRLIDQAVRSGVTPAVAGRWRHEANREDLPKASQGRPLSDLIEYGGAGKYVGNCHVCGEPYDEGEYVIVTACNQCIEVIKEGREKGVFQRGIEEEGDSPGELVV